MPTELLRPFPLAVLAAAAGCAGVVGFTASAGVRDDMLVASVVAILAAAVAVWTLARRPGFAAVVAQAPAMARTLFVIGALAVGVQLAWLTPFIIAPDRVTWTPSPLRPMPPTHSCGSSYWVAGCAVTSTPHVYDDVLYNLPQADPSAIRSPRKLGRLNMDNYEYPPPFLVAPRLLGLVTSDFWGFRRLWFALNLGFVIVVAVLIARRLDDRLATHAVWLTPFVIAGPAIIATFQVGNVQLAMIALSALAMYCFDRRAYAIGGALLAFAILGKLYPGVFVLYLLLRRDWRAIGWTAVCGVLLIAISVADVGWEPYRAFVREMPALMSGEAFSAFRNPAAVGNNGSVPGLVFKLKLWGVPHMDFGAMRLVGWAYTLVVVAGTTWLATRVRPAGREPVIWLAILVLATMRSPFMATYAFFPVMWLAVLMAPIGGRAPRALWPIALCWCALALAFGPASIPPHWNAAWTTVQTVLTFVLVAAVLRQLRLPAAASLAVDATAAAPA
jgi:alpha-1,2-mannosyltransferase